MMRRLTYLLTGAVFGGGLVAFALQGIPVGTISAVAASSETYRQLNLFGDVFEKIRTDYVEKPEDAKLIESAISGMLSGRTTCRRWLTRSAWRLLASRHNRCGSFQTHHRTD